MKIAQTLLAATVLLTVAGTTQAALIPALDGQVVFDTDQNITLLANASLANTNTFGVSGINADGTMSWATAQSWIGAMNTAKYLGYNDWRLPTTLQPDASCQYQNGGSAGENCVGSEMGHLFYNELGGVAGQSIATTHNPNYGLLQNLQSNYWSATESALNTNDAWYFDFRYGYQSTNSKGTIYNGNYIGPNYYALAVRPGQVTAVPVPAAVWLLVSGLAGLISMARPTAA